MLVFEFTKTLAGAVQSVSWMAAVSVVLFLTFIGVTLAVALFDSGKRGQRAAWILKDLLAVLRRGGRGPKR